jgi:hypothetical protein
MTGQAGHRPERCVPMAAGSAEIASEQRSSEHLADHSANSVITGPPALLAAGNRGYRSPKVLEWAEQMGNVGSYLLRSEPGTPNTAAERFSLGHCKSSSDPHPERTKTH